MDILDKILSFSTTNIQVEVDPAKLRPVDVPIIEADITKLQSCIPWERTYPLEQTLEETLNYWRNSL